MARFRCSQTLGMSGTEAHLFCLRAGGYAMQRAVWSTLEHNREHFPYDFVYGSQTLIWEAGEVDEYHAC
jgi:hypothetical protein